MKGNDTYIRRVTDEFTKKDLLVAIKGVDNETKELINLSLEGKCFSIRHCWRRRSKTEENREGNEGKMGRGGLKEEVKIY